MKNWFTGTVTGMSDRRGCVAPSSGCARLRERSGGRYALPTEGHAR